MAETSMTDASLLLWTLLEVSEKAARIARECRSERELFALLVQEKSGDERNTRFLHDFKTLADVLIQETVKHHLTQKFPALRTHIRGEETNEFTNAKGHHILVEMKPTEAETADLLEQVLDGNSTAATLLAHAAHVEPRVEETIRREFERVESQLQQQAVPLDDIGLWIDPIDGTYEYVQGSWDDAANGGPSSFGNITNIERLPSVKAIVLSSTEEPETIEKLSKEFTVVHCAGAGYKILTVALGWCDVYVCTKRSTYRWDVCAPHALLEAQGGGVRELFENKPILYNVADRVAAKNTGGVLAYRDKGVLERVLDLIGREGIVRNNLPEKGE